MHKTIKVLAALAIITSIALPLRALPTDHYAPHSALASGMWFKIPVNENGIYQLTSSVLTQLGFEDWANVKVYGRGGAMMSEIITADVIDDLHQVPVVRMGDRLLFYAQAPLSWRSNEYFPFYQSQHPYATQAYYFITQGTADDSVSPEQASNEVVGEAVSTFTERLFHEQELSSPGETGRILLGEDMTNTPSMAVKFSMPGRIPGSTVRIRTRFGVDISQGNVELKFKCNGTELPASVTDRTITSGSSYYYSVIETNKTFTPEGATTELECNVERVVNGTIKLARLDYVTINYERQLAMDDGLLQFAQPATTGTDFHYAISGANDSTIVWDVTRPWAPIAMNTTFTDDGKLLFSPVAGGYREYVAFDPRAQFNATQRGTKPDNQDLHGAATPDMIIITNSEYLAAAKRLAEYHTTADDMEVLVATDTQVYNEFSQGTPDAMAYRMLCKMMWDRGSDTTGHHLQYLLLMGDGTYDNRLLTSEVKAMNMKPLLTWQTENSHYDLSSYTTDDIFAMLEDGNMTMGNAKINIAVGRMPVNSLNEANTMVDKAIKYMSVPDYGTWKNNSLNVADDQDNGTHMEQAEEVITTARSHGGEDMMYNHIFIDAFTETTVGAARTFPQAKAQMMSKLQEGTLWWNYTGHASANNWGSEGMLRRNDITDGLYYDHLPVLYAATCSFAKYDAIQQSGSENMVLNPRGGVVVAVSPVREVLMMSNGPLNSFVAEHMFARDENGKPNSVGEVIRLAKNERTEDTNKLRYIVLGDPALRLALPQYKVHITAINGTPVSPDDMPTFRGRQTMRLTGHIADYKGNKVQDFNGVVRSTLYDSEQSVTTHGYGDGKEFTFLERPNKLALTADTVIAGDFTITLTIPSELMATYDNYSPSLINLYAYDRTTQREASGSNSDFYIYGYDDAEVTDTDGPLIQFFGLNNHDFVDGIMTDENPIAIATISDISGVNFSTAGVGHNMTLLLDGKTTYSNLANYYNPEPCEVGTQGTISFPLSQLEVGAHTLRLRVWDVHNNVSEKTINFGVSKGLKPEVVEIYATPNPATTSATFYVQHNRPNAQVQVGIEVFDLMGRTVWSTKQSGRSNNDLSFPITWDLTRNGGGRVPRGIYIYRATISTDGEHEASKGKKLAVCAE